jgi:4-hydroxybenzoate polyprenyltransferase
MTTATTSRFVLLARDIKLSHSIFALPFALLGGFLATTHQHKRISLASLGLIVVCMVLGRTVAMTVNRWADRFMDERNPRTAGRAIPAGKLSARYMLTVAIVCSIGFVVATAGFYALDRNPWPLLMSPVVLVWLAAYSFAKRFTSLCHLVLGSALAISPLAAVVAIDPSYLSQPTPYLLALMVMCWVAGFDIIYALQDVDFDRTERVFSMPARFGVRRALFISQALHTISTAALIAIVFVSATLGVFFAIGVALTIALLVVEHTIVWTSKTNHIDMAFFTINGIISVILGGLGVVDVLMAM